MDSVGPVGPIGPVGPVGPVCDFCVRVLCASPVYECYVRILCTSYVCELCVRVLCATSPVSATPRTELATQENGTRAPADQELGLPLLARRAQKRPSRENHEHHARAPHKSIAA